MSALPTGLTSADVAERRQQGLANRTRSQAWRDYLQIFRRNLLTWFNAMVVPAAVALFYLGEYQGALAVSGMALANTILGLIQEIRAKIHLDRLAILTETRARVLRDGREQEIPSGEVVQDDVVLLGAGDTVVADGPVVQASFLEIDEALLTGESDPVRRQVGEELLSGSFCVAGEGSYRAARVGAAAFAQETSAQARAYRFTSSPLTRVIDRIVQILTLVALGLIVLYTGAYLLAGFPKSLQQERDFVQMIAATITSMVPQGMVLTATVAFTLGALVMSRRGAMVQRLNAVETMAAIDVVCTDKTGTLTTNRLMLDKAVPLGEANEEAAREALRLFAAASIDRKNRNLQAVKAALGDAAVDLMDQVPFKSQNRYSAVRLRYEGRERLLVLGAVEALRPYLPPPSPQSAGLGPSLDDLVEEYQQRGMRLLFLAEGSPAISLADRTTLPDLVLRPVALACLSDELRPEAGDVLERLHAQGIDFKVVSGDNAETVQGTVRHLHLPLARDPVVAGTELAGSADPAELIRSRSVFGRIAPQQKMQIVEALQRDGRHVAMIGDGVNDVLPLKKADLGIAMGEGSPASKTVAGLVLETNDFALLPETLEEGRVIVRNLRRSAKLFLTKNVYSLILILAYYLGLFGVPFPYVPQQVTLMNWLVIGIPALVIAVSRERTTRATKTHFLREVGSFSIRTGVVFGVVGTAVLALAGPLFAADEKLQRTMLLSTLILLGITALWRSLTDQEPAGAASDVRFRLIGLAAIPCYLLAMYWPFAADFFRLSPLGLTQWIAVIAAAGVGYGLTLASDRLVRWS